MEPADRALGILRSLDKAFEWLVLILILLVSVIFQFLTYLMTPPEQHVNLITKIMFLLVVPLLIPILGWLWQSITIDDERKMFMRLFSWASILLVFPVHVIIFVTFLMLNLIRMHPEIAAVILLMFGLSSWFLPTRRILDSYRAATIGSNFWERGRYRIWMPYMLGIIITGIILLLPFSFFYPL